MSKVRNPDGSRYRLYSIDAVNHLPLAHPPHSSKTAILKIIKANNYKLVK